MKTLITEPKTKMTSYVVNIADMNRIAAIATAKDLSVSAQLRLVVADFLKRESRKK